MDEINEAMRRKAIKNEGELYSLLLQKDSSGMSGGLIGMNQVKKEFARLSEAFKVFFNN